MALRIVNESGVGFKARVLHAETGEDLTEKLRILSIRISDINPGQPVMACLEVPPEKIDITVAEAESKQVCPYCGHETEKASK